MRLTQLLLATWFAAFLGPAVADDGPLPASVAAPAADSVAERYLTKTRELALQAMSFLGIDYKYGGNSPETGFDCSGLVHYVFSQTAGLMLPRNAQEISRVGENITREELEPGDLCSSIPCAAHSRMSASISASTASSTRQAAAARSRSST